MRRPSTVYAPYSEPILMAMLFPDPKKVKSIRREEIVGARERPLIESSWEEDFVFRHEWTGPEDSIRIRKKRTNKAARYFFRLLKENINENTAFKMAHDLVADIIKDIDFLDKCEYIWRMKKNKGVN